MTLGIQKNVKDEPVNTDNLVQKCKCLVYCSSSHEICGAEHGCESVINCGPFGLLGCHSMCEPA
jgi:hypothetical protein